MRQDNKYYCDLCEKETPNIWPQGTLEVCPLCTKMIMSRSNRILHIIKESASQIRGFEKSARDAMLKNPIFAEIMKLDKEFNDTMGKTYKHHTKKRSFMDFMAEVSNAIKTPRMKDDEARSIDLD